MSITSSSFLLLALAAVLLTRAFPAPRSRAWVLSAASLLFIASYLDSVMQVLPLAALLGTGYAFIELLRRTRSGALLCLALASMIGAFVWLKQYSFLSPALRLPFPYLVVGLSYVLFRLLHLMVDAQQGELTERIPPQHFTNYCLNFLSFTAGPIQLYPEFEQARLAPLGASRQEVGRAVSRVVHGFVKVCVASAVLNYFFVALAAKLLASSALALAGSLLLVATCAAVYAAYLYANFAGYMDIVVGVGALMGQRLPENFAQPFAARSFLDFWSRWHMTLSNWFRTYLFNPLLKRMAKRFSSAASARYLAVYAFFVTFLVMGLWHGTTAVFVVYGLLLGAGASVNKLWQMFASRRFGKAAYKKAGEHAIAIYLSRGLTFAYFALALSCLWLDLRQLLGVAGKLGLLGVLGCYLTLTLSSAMGFFVWDEGSRRLSSFGAQKDQATADSFWSELGLAAQILLVVAVGSFFHKSPEFVYRAF